MFAARQLEQYTMVIEYIGQLIRNELCESREKIYEQQVVNQFTVLQSYNVSVNALICLALLCPPSAYSLCEKFALNGGVIRSSWARFCRVSSVTDPKS